ncbi:serine-rich adhesin for platelets-like [Littorina saxatilis]|uniref:serine-rich adhesin for platelets-like n=1 Tax=Littorina saxatilis TaxID=31220 RepID=UPI0038B4AB20
MKVSLSLLSLVLVVLTIESASAQPDWVKKWSANKGNGNIKKASDSFQPSGVLDMLGYGTFGRRSRRSAGIEHKVDATVETSESDNAMTSQSETATTSANDDATTPKSDTTATSESDTATTSESDDATTSESDKTTTSESDKALQRWRLMCPVINANTDIDTEQQGPGLSLKTFDTVFRIADRNKDGRIDAQELDLYEQLIEAYELCRMLE